MVRMAQLSIYEKLSIMENLSSVIGYLSYSSLSLVKEARSTSSVAQPVHQPVRHPILCAPSSVWVGVSVLLTNHSGIKVNASHPKAVLVQVGDA